MQKHVQYIYVKCKYMQIKTLYCLIMDTCVSGKIIYTNLKAVATSPWRGMAKRELQFVSITDWKI